MARCGSSKRMSAPPSGSRCDRGRLLRLAVAHLRAAADRRVRRLARISSCTPPPPRRAGTAPPTRRRELRCSSPDKFYTYVGPLVPPRQAEAPVLPDRVVDDAGVLPEDVAVRVDKVARLRLFAGVALDGGGIVAVRREADVLAVGLFRVDQSAVLREFRASGLNSSPSGNSVCASCSCVIV